MLLSGPNQDLQIIANVFSLQTFPSSLARGVREERGVKPYIDENQRAS